LTGGKRLSKENVTMISISIRTTGTIQSVTTRIRTKNN
jgi:hypothetical protein